MNEAFLRRLMEHKAPRKNGIRRKARFPLNTKPPRCSGCDKQPPVCTCPKEER